MDISALSLQDIKRTYISLVSDPGLPPETRLAFQKDLLKRIFPGNERTPENDFLQGYFAIALRNEQSPPVEDALQSLKRAQQEGHIEAALFLTQIHRGYYDTVPATLRRPSRASLLEEELLKTEHPLALYHHALYCTLHADFSAKGNITDEEWQKATHLAQRCADMGHIGGYFLQGIYARLQGDDENLAYGVDRWRKGLEKCKIEDILSAPIKARLLFFLGEAVYDGIGAPRDPGEGTGLIRDAAHCGDESAIKWLAAKGDKEPEQAGGPPSWITSNMVVHDFPATDDWQPDSANPLIAGLDRSASGQYYGLAHLGEEPGSYRPTMRVRIHFPDQSALMLRQKIDQQGSLTEAAIEKIIAPLEKLPGLRELKTEIRDLLNYAIIIKKRRQKGLNVKSLGVHMVFTGRPGTGKTHMARLIGSIFYQAGLLEDGHVIEAEPATLIGEYVGWTTSKTQLACEAALGGVLFVDEAYALVETSSSFGFEAVDVIMKMMEDFNGQFVVIAAGYKEKMDQFLMTNPGLRSRFAKTILFKNYTAAENVEVFEIFCAENDYALSADGRQKLLHHLREMKGMELERFANARGVRTLFDEAIRRQAVRLLRENKTSRKHLMLITAEDLPGTMPAAPKDKAGFLSLVPDAPDQDDQ